MRIAQSKKSAIKTEVINENLSEILPQLALLNPKINAIRHAVIKLGK